MKLAILAPLHGSSTDKAFAQIANYSHYLNNQADYRFYFHISKQSSAGFGDQLHELAASGLYPISIAPCSRTTSVVTTLSALIELAQTLEKDGWLPDYVLWHSESDLLIKEGICSEISKYQYGVGTNCFSYAEIEWSHAPLMRLDDRLNRLLEDAFEDDLSNLRIGRTEGCFMDSKTWAFTINKLYQFFDNDFFDNVSNHWCAEEILLPSLARIANLPNLRCRDQLIYTKPTIPSTESDRDPGQDCITSADIINLRNENVFYGAKWFSPDLQNEARLFLQKTPKD